MFYFAYGSNMSYRRLAARIKQPKIVTTASLNEYQLLFNKPSTDGSAKCSINYTGCSTDLTFGVVFEITPKAQLRLDSYEGLGKGYGATTVCVVDGFGNKIEAMTYQATHFTNKLLPYEWYHQHVVFGAKSANLPTYYVQQLLHVKTQPDPNQQRHLKETAIYD